MEQIYNDELMPEDFQQIATAYSKSLKDKGFVFVSLKEEEFRFLVNEVYVILAKMQACLKRMKDFADTHVLQDKICDAQDLLRAKFGGKDSHKFVYTGSADKGFLALVSLENLLLIKLILLAFKSEELELCNQISISIASVFAESFSCEGFDVK